MTNFPALIPTAFRPTQRTGCLRPRATHPLTYNTDTLGDRSPREVLQQVLELLRPRRPASAQRLTELLRASAIVQVPRYCFPSLPGIEELCLILPPPCSQGSRVLLLAVCTDDTLRLGRAGVPDDCMDALRAHWSSPSSTDTKLDEATCTEVLTETPTNTHANDPADALQVLMRDHGAQWVYSLSACFDATLWPVSGAQEGVIVPPSLAEVLSRGWVQAGEVWFTRLDAEAKALLKREGIAPPLLHAALVDCMVGRCAGALDCLDQFDAGVDQDPLLRAWRQYLSTTDDTGVIPSLSAYNYLVSSDPVVKASRVPLWADPLFMSRVQHFAAYQAAAESLLRSGRNSE